MADCGVLPRRLMQRPEGKRAEPESVTRELRPKNYQRLQSEVRRKADLIDGVQRPEAPLEGEQLEPQGPFCGVDGQAAHARLLACPDGQQGCRHVRMDRWRKGCVTLRSACRFVFDALSVNGGIGYVPVQWDSIRRGTAINSRCKAESRLERECGSAKGEATVDTLPSQMAEFVGESANAVGRQTHGFAPQDCPRGRLGTSAQSERPNGAERQGRNRLEYKMWRQHCLAQTFRHIRVTPRSADSSLPKQASLDQVFVNGFEVSSYAHHTRGAVGSANVSTELPYVGTGVHRAIHEARCRWPGICCFHSGMRHHWMQISQSQRDSVNGDQGRRRARVPTRAGMEFQYLSLSIRLSASKYGRSVLSHVALRRTWCPGAPSALRVCSF